MPSYTRYAVIALSIAPLVFFSATVARSSDVNKILDELSKYEKSFDSSFLFSVRYDCVSETPPQTREASKRIMNRIIRSALTQFPTATDPKTRESEIQYYMKGSALNQTIDVAMHQGCFRMTVRDDDGDLRHDYKYDGENLLAMDSDMDEERFQKKPLLLPNIPKFTIQFLFDWCIVFDEKSIDRKFECIDSDTYRIVKTYPGGFELTFEMQKIEDCCVPVKYISHREGYRTTITQYKDFVRQADVLIPQSIVRNTIPGENAGGLLGIPHRSKYTLN